MFASPSQFAMCFLVSHDSKRPVVSLVVPVVTARRYCLLLVVDIGKVTEISAVATSGTGDWISLFVKFHPKIQTHAVQNFLDLVQRLLAEILRGQHLAFAALHQITNRPDIRISDSCKSAPTIPAHQPIELIIAWQRWSLDLRVSEVVGVFFKVNEDRHVILDQLGSQSDRVLGFN